MKAIYDPKTDVLHIILSAAAIEKSDEKKPGVTLDYDRDGNFVGMEIHDASKRTGEPPLA